MFVDLKIAQGPWFRHHVAIPIPEGRGQARRRGKDQSPGDEEIGTCDSSSFSSPKLVNDFSLACDDHDVPDFDCDLYRQDRDALVRL